MFWSSCKSGTCMASKKNYYFICFAPWGKKRITKKHFNNLFNPSAINSCLPLMRGLWGASFQNVHLEEMKGTHQLHFSLTLPQFLYMPPPLLLLYRSPLLMRLPLASSSATVLVVLACGQPLRMYKGNS